MKAMEKKKFLINEGIVFAGLLAFMAIEPALLAADMMQNASPIFTFICMAVVATDLNFIISESWTEYMNPVSAAAICLSAIWLPTSAARLNSFPWFIPTVIWGIMIILSLVASWKEPETNLWDLVFLLGFSLSVGGITYYIISLFGVFERLCVSMRDILDFSFDFMLRRPEEWGEPAVFQKRCILMAEVFTVVAIAVFSSRFLPDMLQDASKKAEDRGWFGIAKKLYVIHTTLTHDWGGISAYKAAYLDEYFLRAKKDPQKIIRSDRKDIHLYWHAAYLGSSYAMCRLAEMAKDAGKEVMPFFLYHEAAAADDPEGIARFVSILIDMDDSAFEDDVMELCLKAIVGGWDRSRAMETLDWEMDTLRFRLGNYLTRHGVRLLETEPLEGFRLLMVASGCGNPAASLCIAEIYAQGCIPFERNMESSEQFRNRAGRQRTRFEEDRKKFFGFCDRLPEFRS